MSGSTKRSQLKNKKKQDQSVSFEDHISYAEEVLLNLEHDDLDLEEAVENYSKALNRIKLAKNILEKTQNKIEIIESEGPDEMKKKKR